ncbi:MAG: pitrilysin family protein [Eubacteriales bacterium]|nr:pitrilysin family protein [Eubacteriales bacterium]
MKIKQYKSGLRLVLNNKDDSEIISFRIFVNVASKDETKEEYGIAHFLEHMFFKSTKEHSYQELANYFDELGTQKNAYTGTYNTCYYFKCLKNVYEQSMQLFSEMFFNCTYNKNEIENEKQVILEEYKMGNDDVQKKCILNAYNSLFYGTPLEHDVIGTPKHIKSFTADMLKNFKQKHYLPHKIVISVSGNVTIKEVETLLKKYFAQLFEGSYNEKYKKADFIEVNPKNKFILQNKDNEQSIVYILTDLGQKTNKQMYAYDLLFAILGYGMSSKFYNIIRGEKALVYYIDADTSSVGSNNFAEIMFATSNDKVCIALTSVLNILQDCKNGNITNEELEKSKNKYIAGMIYSNETNGGISLRNGSDLINDNKIETQNQIVQDIRAVTLKQVIACAKEFYGQQNYVVSAIGKCNKKDLHCYKH